MPFFSVVIPTYNRADRILQVIRSFQNQSFEDFELIIIDDGSTDNTRNVIDTITDPRIKYYFIKNSERGAARNFGARKASGNYLNFFDSDDTAYGNHLSNAYKFIQENKEPPVFHVGYRIVDEKGKTLIEEKNFNYDIYQRLIKTNFFGCNSVFIQKNIFLENPFNESRILASSEDWELWLRISSRYPIISSDEITFQINNHNNRSLFTIPPEKIENRDLLMLELLLKDMAFVKKYKKKIPMFCSERYTFFALIYSLTKRHRLKTIAHLLKSLQSDPFVITRRRFWASLKHLI